VKLREASDLLFEMINLNELLKEMDAPEDFETAMQYLALAQQAMNANNWKEAEACHIVVVASITKHRDDDPFFAVVEPMANFQLANALRKQGKYMEALSFLSRVLGMSLEPERMAKIQETQRMLAESPDEFGVLGQLLSTIIGQLPQVVFANTYTVFVDCALSVREIPYNQIEEVVEDGIRYMEDLGQPDWACGLHLLRARICSEYGREEEALKEAQIALASRRREPEYHGTEVWVALNDIADYQIELGSYGEAMVSAQEVIDNDSAPAISKRRAYGSMALAYAEKGDLDEAREIAEKYLAMAVAVGNTWVLARAYSITAYIFLRQGEISASASAAASAWNAICREKPPSPIIIMLRCAQVRLAQARHVLRLQIFGPISGSISSEVTPKEREIASKRVKSASQWVGRAQAALDVLCVSRGGGYPSIPRIEKLRAEASALAMLLS
jgi:tetratricopeptide (TPR) repeat protein